MTEVRCKRMRQLFTIKYVKDGYVPSMKGQEDM